MNDKIHHSVYGLFHNDANEPAGIKISHPFLYLLPLLPTSLPLVSVLILEGEKANASLFGARGFIRADLLKFGL